MRALKLFVLAVTFVGAAAILASGIATARSEQPLAWLAFAALAIVAGAFKLNFTGVSASISVSDTFFIAAAILFGPEAATVAIALDSLVISARRGDNWLRLGFNVAAPALSLYVGSRLSYAMGGISPLAFSHAPVADVALPLMLLVVVYFCMNSGLTATAIALESGASALRVWTGHFMWLSVGYLAAASAAFCLIMLAQQSSLAAAAMVLPLIGVFYQTLRSSFGRLEDARRHVGDIDRLYRSTVETLAMAIDAKDDVTHSHVRRVQSYALALARALGIEDEHELKALEAAALLHDTGKLAVPEHILNKPGKLTPAEFEQMKLHVDVGADILELVDFPFPVVPIVRCHHECWDGTGYPRGVKGEDIPIGARILTVVDCFDALTSDRPYRRRMTDDEAFEILLARRGSAFDPHVVDTFFAIHKEIRLPREDTAEEREVMRRLTQKPACIEAQVPTGGTVAPASDMMAFVSLARLASGASSVEEVLSVASGLVARVMPGASGAWFLCDAAQDRLDAVAVFGPSAGQLRGLSMPRGQRLSGWVAVSRQSIVDSDAAIDFDGDPRFGVGLRRITSVPLLVGTSLVGVLTVYAPSTAELGGDHGRVLEMLAPHLATAVQAAQAATGTGPTVDNPADFKSPWHNGRPPQNYSTH